MPITDSEIYINGSEDFVMRCVEIIFDEHEQDITGSILKINGIYRGEKNFQIASEDHREDKALEILKETSLMPNKKPGTKVTAMSQMRNLGIGESFFTDCKKATLMGYARILVPAVFDIKKASFSSCKVERIL